MGLPVLAIGSDRAWLARLERLLALRGELHWQGTWTPDDIRRGRCSAAALWLIDGDDPVVTRSCGPSRGADPIRLHFYRHPTLATLRDCTRTGAHGCLDKRAAPDVVRRAIRAAGLGLFALDPALLCDALTSMPPPPLSVWASPADLTSAPWAQLTGRQRQIVRCAAQGLSNKQIARELGISPETVKTHLHHAFEREGISGRGALLAAQQSWSQRIGGPLRALPEQQPRQQLLL